MTQVLRSTASVVEETGFSADLLRVWERRYGLLRPERSAGGHRRYGAEDLRVLRAIRAGMQQGRTIGELASAGRDGLLSDGSAAADEAGRLVEAALALDADGARRAIEGALVHASPAGAIDDVLLPALRRVGDLWSSGRCSVASEHLLSGLVRDRLGRLLADAAAAAHPDQSAVLTACLPGERHEIAGMVAAWRVARAGFRVTWLGADLPLADLLRAGRGPWRGCLLSVSTRPTWSAHRDALIAALPALPPLAVGGAGAPTDDPAWCAAGGALPADPVRWIGSLG